MKYVLLVSILYLLSAGTASAFDVAFHGPTTDGYLLLKNGKKVPFQAKTAKKGILDGRPVQYITLNKFKAKDIEALCNQPGTKCQKIKPEWKTGYLN